MSDNPLAYKRILVAVDGSDHARHALEHAAMLAKAFSAKLLVATVATDEWALPEFGGGPAGDEVMPDKQQVEAAASKLLDDEIGALTGSDTLELVPIVAFGVPDERIVELADEHNADLIVVGSRGLSGFRRFLLGSVSYKVARSAERPVLVVHTT